MQKTKKWRILVLSTLATSFLALQTAEAKNIYCTKRRYFNENRPKSSSHDWGYYEVE